MASGDLVEAELALENEKTPEYLAAETRKRARIDERTKRGVGLKVIGLKSYIEGRIRPISRNHVNEISRIIPKSYSRVKFVRSGSSDV